MYLCVPVALTAVIGYVSMMNMSVTVHVSGEICVTSTP